MKLIPFTFTNEYDNESSLYVNPNYVVTLRPQSTTKTVIMLVSGQISVDGKLDDVAFKLSGDYDPGETVDVAKDTG